MTLGMKYDQYYDEGKAEGISIGRAEGLVEGRTEGRSEYQKSVINAALDSNMTPAEIVEKLKIPEDVVKQVLEERKCRG